MKLHPKTPLPFVLALVFNIILVAALELVLVYRYPAPLTAGDLEQVDSRYEECHVFGETGSGQGVRFYRVRTREGQTDIVPMQPHSFVPSRARLHRNKILWDLDLDSQDSRQIMIGTKFYTVFISDGSVYTGLTSGAGSLQSALAWYMGIGAVLAFLELLLLEKLRGN